MRHWLLLLCFTLPMLHVSAQDRVNWEITPRIAAPGQPFKLQIQVESDVVLGGAHQVSRSIKVPPGMALRLSGQIVRADSNEATLNFNGVAPEEPGEYIIPSFTLRFARKIISVPEIRLTVSDKITYKRESSARAELILPERTYYVGEYIPGIVRLRGGDNEYAAASFGLECFSESFSITITAERQPLSDNLGEGLDTSFLLTPLRSGIGEITLTGIMLLQTKETIGFNQLGRERPFTFRRSLKVEHVPERGRPADWSGAIGQFVAESVQVSKDEPEVGEPIRMRAILTGEGNLDRIPTPELKSDEVWDVLPTNERRRSAENQRMFVYTLVPRLPGNLQTPAISFTTFNPNTKEFSRIAFKPAAVKVTGNPQARFDLVTSDPSAPIGKLTPTITGLIDPQPRRANSIFQAQAAVQLSASSLFWSGNVLFLLGIGAATATTGILGYLAAHPEIRIRRRARAALRTALTQAVQARLKGDTSAFAQAIVRGLQTGTAALLGAADNAMTQTDIQRVLPDANRGLLDTLFHRAHGERFAPLVNASELNQDDEALGLLRRLLTKLL